MKNINNTVLICVDNSDYTETLLQYGAKLAESENTSATVLHVIPSAGQHAPVINDLSGTLEANALAGLQNTLTESDEKTAKKDILESKNIIEKAVESLRNKNIDVDVQYRHGELIETIDSMQEKSSMVVLGKRGSEHMETGSATVGKHLQAVLETATVPIFVVPRVLVPMKNILVAYDGKESIKKGIAFLENTGIFKGANIHFVIAGADADTMDISEHKTALESVGYCVHSHTNAESDAAKVIEQYCKDNTIDVVVAGAYGHSDLRRFFMGSTTTKILESVNNIGFLLFR